MKNLKVIATIAIVLIALFAIATASAETYTMTAVVTAWEQIGDTDLYVVTVTDENGEEWDFFDDEEVWKVGDMVTVTMLDMSGAHDEADEIMDVEKVGHLEWHDLFNWLDKIYQ